MLEYPLRIQHRLTRGSIPVHIDSRMVRMEPISLPQPRRGLAHPFQTSLLCLLFLLLFCCAGCAPKYKIRQDRNESWYDMMHKSALHTKQISYHSSLFLHRYLLEDRYKRNPIQTLTEFDREICTNLERDNLFAMAELSYNVALHESKKPEEQAQLFLTASRYAYAYLFEEIEGALPETHDPRYRLACDFYNRSLAEWIKIKGAQGATQKNFEKVTPLLNGSVQIASNHSPHLFTPQDFEELHDAYQYRIKGIQFVHRQYGLGAPLIALKTTPTKLLSIGVDQHDQETIQTTYPATFLLRYQGSICSRMNTEPEEAIGELYNPTYDNYARVEEQEIPLEADFTTPLAFTLAQGQAYNGFIAMIKPEAFEKRQGLYLLQPYDPNKIPVVFIHGLMSYPYTWVPMINSLFSDVSLNQKYQFWFYAYTTGNPVILNALRLRQTLLQAQSVFDPQGDDPSFSKMVLVGHSMGGVLSQLMVQESPEDLWIKTSRSNKPIEALDATEDIKARLHAMFEFKPLPFVSRVVFLATPHRGSESAENWLGRLGSSLISLPANTLLVFKNVLDAIGELDEKKSDVKITGIRSLSPKNAVLVRMAETPIAPHVRFHSLIANREEAGIPGGTDGLVTYESAHWPGAESELILHDGHYLHTNPNSIREVRRILIEHLKSSG